MINNNNDDKNNWYNYLSTAMGHKGARQKQTNKQK